MAGAKVAVALCFFTIAAIRAHCVAAVGSAAVWPKSCTKDTLGGDGASLLQHSGATEASSVAAGHRARREQVFLRPNASIGEVLVVPSLKFIFCFIPKNACTQFNRLVNDLNRIAKTGDICTDGDPNYASSLHGDFDHSDVEAALADSTWTKAVFLRDPLERLVSAYLSKCIPPQECGGCMEFPADAEDYPTLDEVAERLEWGRNRHFDPQSSFCGGLPETLAYYDFVGHMTRDYGAMAAQVREMLKLVLQRGSRLNLSHNDVPRDAGASATLAPFGASIGEVTSRILEAGDRYFPAQGPDAKDPHVHAEAKVAAYFGNRRTFDRALKHYAEDYDRLPGLAKPVWSASWVRDARAEGPQYTYYEKVVNALDLGFRWLRGGIKAAFVLR